MKRKNCKLEDVFTIYRHLNNVRLNCMGSLICGFFFFSSKYYNTTWSAADWLCRYRTSYAEETWIKRNCIYGGPTRSFTWIFNFIVGQWSYPLCYSKASCPSVCLTVLIVFCNSHLPNQRTHNHLKKYFPNLRCK